ncbi:MAG TPA: hypothetical protein VH092_02490 [Urbifossiella sp.]|jgi:hypothetical protein|nr:hypothetical protein [Urbifossiella sp.]
MAALRQGGKELGAALKAFPESISIDEPGTAFNPTQGEIAESNRSGSLWDRVQEGRDRAAISKEPPDKGMDRE